jgi:cyclic pyranopterin phosphate synthase
MPEREYSWLPRRDVLDFEEIARLVEVFSSTAVGVDRVRLTGGEPLVRRDLSRLVKLIAANPAIRDLALTTNGVLLEENAESLKSAGLHRVTVSLDTLRPDRFEALTRFDTHARVLAGIAAAARAGFPDLKIDSVLMRGVNDDEILSLLEYGRDSGAEVRFIEYMDVGGATNWSTDRVVSRREILETVEEHYGQVEHLPPGTGAAVSAPAERFRLPDGLVFGVIASTTAPFCRSCDRSRLTADGLWYLCLYAKTGIDLRGPLRAGASADELRAILASAWNVRNDRGAESRLAVAGRAPLVPLSELRRDPHLEMHTRGG